LEKWYDIIARADAAAPGNGQILEKPSRQPRAREVPSPSSLVVAQAGGVQDSEDKYADAPATRAPIHYDTIRSVGPGTRFTVTTDDAVLFPEASVIPDCSNSPRSRRPSLFRSLSSTAKNFGTKFVAFTRRRCDAPRPTIRHMRGSLDYDRRGYPYGVQAINDAIPVEEARRQQNQPNEYFAHGCIAKACRDAGREPNPYKGLPKLPKQSTGQDNSAGGVDGVKLRLGRTHAEGRRDPKAKDSVSSWEFGQMPEYADDAFSFDEELVRRSIDRPEIPDYSSPGQLKETNRRGYTLGSPPSSATGLDIDGVYPEMIIDTVQHDRHTSWWVTNNSISDQFHSYRTTVADQLVYREPDDAARLMSRLEWEKMGPMPSRRSSSRR